MQSDRRAFAQDMRGKEGKQGVRVCVCVGGGDSILYVENALFKLGVYFRSYLPEFPPLSTI